MADTGWLYPGTAANISNGGNAVWQNVNNANADDTSYASLTSSKNGASDYLRLTNFGASIPSGATIDGFEFVICKNVGLGSSGIKDSGVYLVSAGSAVGSNLASASEWPYPNMTEISYGGSTNKCGWTSASQTLVVASTFGFEVCVNAVAAVGCYVDFGKIKIHYTEGGGGKSLLNSLLRKPFRHMLVR